MFKQLIYTALWLLSEQVYAQSADINDDFEQFSRGQQQGFDSFVEANDREFIQMLEDNWQEFRQMPALKRQKQPKPESLPGMQPLTEKSRQKLEQAKAQVNKSEVTVVENTLAFFGHELVVTPLNPPAFSVGKKALGEFWQVMSQQGYSVVTKQLLSYKEELALSDWAYWLLVNRYSQSQASNDQQANALSWFLLNKTGYQIKVALGGDELFLLMLSLQTIYEVPYYTISGNRYYQLTAARLDKVGTYKGQYQPENKPLDLGFSRSLKTQPTVKYRSLDFGSDNEKKSVSIPYDLQKVRYLKTYPQIDLKYYFQATIDPITEQGLRQQLSPYLSADPMDSAGELLSFIHQAFPYAIDEQQFGKENYLLIEEILHYQASDCEDRSFLYAWLVRNLLGKKIVGLDYPGHVSTALLEDGELVSADPTYIGAELGQIMPKYVNVEPTVIEF